jgi:hypothetical protein
MKLAPTRRDWRPMRRNTPIAFAPIHVRAIRLHQKGASRWTQLPARPRLKGRALVFGHDGKIQWQPILEFNNRAVDDAFSHALIVAVLEFAPDALTAVESAA